MPVVYDSPVAPVRADGSVAFSANQSHGGFKLTNVGEPTASTDAATKNYVDTHTPSLTGVILANGTVPFTAAQSMGGFKLTNVAEPTVSTDAATKNYVDTHTGAGTITGAGTANTVPKWSSASALTNSAITEVGGSVGVGIAAPAYPLDVRNGTQIHLSGTVGQDDGAYLIGTANGLTFGGAASFNGSVWTAKATVASIVGCAGGLVSVYTNSGLTAGSTYGPTERLRVTAAGGVIIATGAALAEPGAGNLSVAGAIACTTVNASSAVNATVNVVTADVYANGGWFRNNTSGTGLYNSATGRHFASIEGGNYWGVNSGYGMKFWADAFSTAVRGYIYTDGTNFGMLDSAGAWMYYAASGGNFSVARSLVQNSSCYIFPGSVSGLPAYQASYYLASHASYGLYSNTGLYLAGNFWAIGSAQLGATTMTGALNMNSYDMNNGGMLNCNILNAGSYFACVNGYAAIKVGNNNPGGYCFVGNGNTSYNSLSGGILHMQAQGNALVWDAAQFYPQSRWNLGHPSFYWGTAYIFSGVVTSDRRLKTNIRPTAYRTDFLRQLRPVDFEWIDSTPAPPQGQQHGFIAQEVAALDADFGAISRDPAGEPTGLNYDQFIPVLVATIQELDARLTALEKEKTDGKR